MLFTVVSDKYQFGDLVLNHYDESRLYALWSLHPRAPRFRMLRGRQDVPRHNSPDLRMGTRWATPRLPRRIPDASPYPRPTRLPPTLNEEIGSWSRISTRRSSLLGKFLGRFLNDVSLRLVVTKPFWPQIFVDSCSFTTSKPQDAVRTITKDHEYYFGLRPSSKPI